MLDVRDMSEEDKLFNFMAGLKPWAQTELRRQGVKDLPTAIAAADRLGDYKVPNEPEQRSDAIRQILRGREQETGPARVGAMQLGTLQVQSRGCEEAHPKGLVMVPGRINGKEMKALVDTGPRITLFPGRPKAGAGRPNVGQSGEGCELKSGASKRYCDAELCVGSWSGQCKFVAVGLDDFDVILGIDFFVNANVIILPRMCGIFISGGDKPSFVKGEYDGVTAAGKKSRVAEARSSNASSSKEGAHAPRLAGFSCIGTMQEEMHRRWTKAQQVCGAEPETFTCEEMLKRERECEVGHSGDVREAKRASVRSTSEEKESTAAASTRTSTSVGGVVCKTLEVQCGRHAHWTRQPVTTGVGTGVCGSRQTVCWLVLVSWHGAGAQHMAHCWAGRENGRVWCGQAARQGDVQACVGSQCRQTGARMGEQAPMCGDVRQAVRTGARRCGRLSAGWQTVGTECARCAGKLGRQAGCARTGSAARAHGRQADDCRQRPRLGGWLRMLKHKTCAGHVMGRLRLVTAHLHGNSGKLQARRLWTVFHGGCRQFWSVFPSSWGCQLHCYVFICFGRVGHKK
ncbi:UNVERIFIED_CONTAM: hypothetical protein Scaly_1082900 [Sesamum calycinum]|uniref:Uncharacterized protein n=1 Tax=Sesamum calycinum TaxID=2727403 RepID=A0AAW2QLL4_9LAMI